MKAFADLTERGQIHRLRRLALAAFRHYDLDAVRFQFLAYNYNCMFHFTTPAGVRYVLRVNRPGSRTKTDIESEMALLAAISRETDVVVPTPVANRRGALVTTTIAPGIPESRHCAIFTWISGRSLNHNPSLATMRTMGATMARLQNHADRFQPPPSFTTRQHDTVWEFGEPKALLDDTEEVLPPEQRAVILAAHQRAQAELDRRYRDTAGLRFLHADFHLWNVKIRRGEIQVLDFDDSVWCFPAQDIGIALAYLQYRPNHQALREAFLTGYTDCRPLPGPEDGLIETARHARSLELISFLHQAENPSIRAILPNMLEAVVPDLRRWLA